MVRRPHFLLAAILFALVLLAGNSSTAAGSTRSIPGFEVFCFYSHSAKDDPIKMPGMPGMSMHLHDFAGNPSTTASSTPSSLRTGGTNCDLKADTAAYWAPTLYSHGVAVHPDRLHAYYRWGQVNDYARIRPIPAGLKMVAGNSMATAPQSTQVVGWNCGVQGARLYDHPISCTSGHKVVLHVFFPNCWDGKHLDSADHRSHMTYPTGRGCPSAFPVRLPKIVFHITYGITDGRGYTLSSDPMMHMTSGMSLHADFWNTWNQDELVRQIDACLNAGQNCDLED